ncbi:M12 family metallo-peptidase [Methylocucumis oryzae]|uniref:Fibronectin type-III domain-containing protein n=1 Tax=Methylocucumis oryzae TaxID=1632867 RepID=A0A0F3IMF2_9GAMM|nr:M12 family metallo-peptidase [Methylocucumis oryzae]KJV07862.1 hypothetical protein VZ94_02090 [Methylocucumis oryzae]
MKTLPNISLYSNFCGIAGLLFTTEVMSEETLPATMYADITYLPTWLVLALSVGLFAGLSSLLWLAYKHWWATEEHDRFKFHYVVVPGLLAGIVFGVLIVNVRQSLMSEKITGLPPTAAGGAQPHAGVAMDLLEQEDFSDNPPEIKIPKKVKDGRARHAKVNLGALNADILYLNLFDDAILTAIRDQIDTTVKGSYVWIGHIEDDSDSQVVLAAKGNVLMGTVETNGRSFEIIYVNGTTHAVREIDPNKIPEQYEPRDLVPDANAINEDGDIIDTSGTTTASGDVTSTGQVIDVLVTYTPKARANAGGVSGMETRILNAVAKANQAYLNSQINMSLNLVGMVEIDYVETGDMTVTLSRLQGTSDGFMDNVHALRNQYGADQVALVSADSNYCGYASIMTLASQSFAPYAFAVVHDDSVYNCLGSNNTFAHELGHNQGNVHNVENSAVAGAAPDAYGYRVCGLFRDIMAYSCSGETRIPYFSNPNVYWNGQPTGILNNADTARSMNVTAPTVAGFRTLVTTVPNAPGNLVANSMTPDSIALTWNDSASDEAGYIVQRSTDNTTWSQVASLGQNATSFNNTGLASDTTFYYRVYAFNSIGNSAYSNMTNATTAAAPAPDTIAPTVAVTDPANGVKVSKVSQTVSAIGSDNVAVTSLKLYIDNKLVSSTNSSSLSYNWNTKK